MKKILSTLFALITVSAVAQQQIDFNAANNGQTFLTCNGFVIDDGGQGGPGYSNGQDVIITICADTIANPGDFISVTFNLFDLDQTCNTGTAQNPIYDYMYVYDGTSTAANTLGVYGGTDLQGVVIQATSLNPSGCLTFRFRSNSCGTGAFTASAACETPCDPPLAAAQILNAPAPDSIAVCVGEVVDFADNGSTAAMSFNLVNYKWDFMDGDTANGTTASHAFMNPGAYTVQLKVTDNNGCLNLNVTDLEVFVSTPPTWDPFPLDTTICLGETVTATGMQVNGDYDSTWSGFPNSNQIDNGCLPDTMLGVSQHVPVDVTGYDAGLTITNMSDIQSICIDMEHSYMGDLVIQIECPNGQLVTLHQQGGGGTQIGVPVQTDNIDCADPTTMGQTFNYCFDPNLTQTWVDWVNAQGGWGLTLPAGSYGSVQPMTGLLGCPVNGTWQIHVIDNWAADDGVITGFQLNLDPALAPDSIEFTPHYGLGSDSSFWDITDPYITSYTPDLNSITITPQDTGVFYYDYTVINNFGCTFDSIFTLTVEAGIQPDAGLDTSLCIGEVYQMQGSIQGGNCDYTLDLYDSYGDGWNGNTITVTINGVATNYTIASGSSNVITLPVTDGDVITLQWNATGSWQSECAFTLYDGDGNVVYQDGQFGTPSTAIQTFTANCAGGAVYAWTPGAVLSDPTIVDPTWTVTQDQEFILTTYPIGHPDCALTDTVMITAAAGSDAGLDGAISMCATAAPVDLFTILGGTPDAGGDWQDAGFNPVTMPYDPSTMPAGDYYYVIGAAGCMDTSMVTVTVNDIASSIDSTDSDCGACNGEVIAAGLTGLAPYQYSIDNGLNYQASGTFSGLCPNTYDVIVQDANGCLDTVSTEVLEINFPTVAADSVDSDCGACNGEVLGTGTGNAPFQYSIDGGVTYFPGAFTGLCPGVYTVTAQDANGCTTTATTEILEINQPTATADSVDSDCGACNGEVIGMGTGNGPFQYSIDGGVTYFPGAITGLCPGVYTVTAQDVNGCTATATTEIVEINFPTAIASSVDSDCGACNGEVSGTGTGNGPFQYSIDGGVTYQAANVFLNQCPGTYTVTAQDVNGCTATASAVITEINFPSIANVSGTDVTCNSACDGTISITGQNLEQYSVDGGVTFQPAPNFNSLCPGTYAIVVDNGYGCQVTDQISLTEPDPLQITFLSPDTTICPDGTVTLSVDGIGGSSQHTYTWQFNGSAIATGNTISHNPAQSGQYCVTLSEVCGSPTDSDCMNVVVEAPIEPMFEGTPLVGCSPLTVNFKDMTAGAYGNVEWDFGDGTGLSSPAGDSIFHTYTYGGEFDVTLTTYTSAGCAFDTTYYSYVAVDGSPDASFLWSPSTIYSWAPEVNFQDASLNGNTYEWYVYDTLYNNAYIIGNSNDENWVFSFPEDVPGTYPVMLVVHNETGCSDTLIQLVTVENDVQLLAPNVFTPDGDGANETWRVYMYGVDIYDFTLMIFNRWGEPVWESHNIEAAWDGTYRANGGVVPDGTYIWIITGKDDVTDKKVTFNGHVSVLR